MNNIMLEKLLNMEGEHKFNKIHSFLARKKSKLNKLSYYIHSHFSEMSGYESRLNKAQFYNSDEIISQIIYQDLSEYEESFDE